MIQGGAEPPTGGGGSRFVPEAPTLPDAVPSGVQDLLNGIFGGLDSVAGGIGDVASGLAEAIGGQAGTIVPLVVDVAGVLG
jgi:phage-related protein